MALMRFAAGSPWFRLLMRRKIRLASRFVPLSDPLFDSPYHLTGPDRPQRPVVLSVPHAARDYPPAMRAALRFAPDDLRALEDRHADSLVSTVTKRGFTVMIAQAPRLWIDLNRDPGDFDRARIDGVPHGARQFLSGKGRSGLGLIPDRMSSHGPLWRHRLSWDEVQARIEALHRPWHDSLAARLHSARSDFGQALLIDVHSMPPLSGRHWPKADMVIGDRFGASAGDRFVSLAMSHFERAGFRVQRNLPYAGGYILDRHGAPSRGVHALQLEICRSLYLDVLGEPDGRTAEMAALVAGLAETLAIEIESALPLAAE